MNMLTSLLNLRRSGLIPVLTCWLDFEDFVYLDSAFCNVALRKTFLTLIQASDFTHEGFVSSNIDRRYYEWLVSRKIKVRNVTLLQQEHFRLYHSFWEMLKDVKILRSLTIENGSKLDYILENYSSTIESFRLVGNTTLDALTDEQLGEILSKINGLTCLELIECTELTDEACNYIVKHCPLLELFDSRSCPNVTHEGLKSMAKSGLQLKNYRIQCALTDTELTQLPSLLPDMKQLYLEGSVEITDEALCTVLDQFKQLNGIVTTYCDKLTEIAYNKITTKFAELYCLTLSGDCITDVILLQIANNCIKLGYLTLADCHIISDEGLCPILQKCREISHLSIGGCVELTEATILNIILYQSDFNLASLSVAGCTKIGDYSVGLLLESCKNLITINYEETSVGDSALIRASVGSERLVFNNEGGYAYNITKRYYRSKFIGIDYYAATQPSHVHSYKIIARLSPYLKVLVFSGPFPDVTDTHIGWFIDSCPLLHTLSLMSGAQLTPALLTHMSEKCVYLRSLEIHYIADLTDDHVQQLLQVCPSFVKLCVENCPLLTDTTVKNIAQYCSGTLETLSLACTPLLTDGGITTLYDACIKLFHLDVRECVLLTDCLFEHIVNEVKHNDKINNVKEIMLNGCTGMTIEGLLLLMESCPDIYHGIPCDMLT